MEQKAKTVLSLSIVTFEKEVQEEIDNFKEKGYTLQQSVLVQKGELILPY